MTTALSRNALLVKYFAQVYRGIPRKHLVKFIYEADVLAREYLGHPLSKFQYQHAKYGSTSIILSRSTLIWASQRCWITS